MLPQSYIKLPTQGDTSNNIYDTQNKDKLISNKRQQLCIN